jgi:hypothetical protein
VKILHYFGGGNVENGGKKERECLWGGGGKVNNVTRMKR